MVEPEETRPVPNLRRKPKMVWPYFLAALAGSILLQCIPLLNLIAVAFGGLFWVGLAFNALLVAFAFDALRGAMPRLLVIYPAAAYATYLWFSIASMAEYRAQDGQMNQANAAQTLRFDPLGDTLVAPEDVVEKLIVHDTLPVAFAPFPTVYDQKRRAFRVLPQDVCKRIRNSSDNSRSKSYLSIEGRVVTNACLLAIPAAPASPSVVVTRETWASSTASNTAEITRSSIVTPDGRRAVIEQGQARILAPIPLPQVYCVLLEDWDCEARLFRWPVDLGRSAGRLGQGKGAFEAAWVARVLKLEPRTQVELDEKGFSYVKLDDAEIQRLTVAAGPLMIKGESYEP